MIIKYDEFLNEEIYDGVKKCVSYLRNELKIDNGKYYFDFSNDKDINLKFYVDIKIEKLKDIPMYYGNVSIREILKNGFENFIIELIIKDDLIDKNYAFSILNHELTHVFQLLDPNQKYYNSFMKMINIEDFKRTTNKFDKFLTYIYYNLEHELEARVSQANEYYRTCRKGIEFKEAWQDFLSKKLHGMLKYLNDFDPIKFIKPWDKKFLIELTNQFNVIYDLEKIKISKLENYYKKWEKLFKNDYKIYLEKSREAILDAINDVQRYEKKKWYCYDESLMYNNDDIDIKEEMKKIVNKFKQIKL